MYTALFSLSYWEKIAYFSTHAVDMRSSAEVCLCLHKNTCASLKALVIIQNDSKRTVIIPTGKIKANKTSMVTLL